MASNGTQHQRPHAEEPDPTMGVHAMLVVGKAPVYLCHFPTFMGRHNFQVILQVTLDDEASGRLGDFRAHFGDDIHYTVRPEEFSITELLPGDNDTPARTAFKADLVTGHSEAGGDMIASGTTVRVDDVTHFDGPGPADKSDTLGYTLFGTEQQFFLAHWITQPPDFNQVVSVNVAGHQFTEEELHREHLGAGVVFLGRPDTPRDRLKPGEKISGRGHVIGAHQFLDLQVEVIAELYFEERALRENPTSAATEKEEAAGSGGE